MNITVKAPAMNGLTEGYNAGMKPIHAVTCANTLMNVPVVQRIPPDFSVIVPYSRAIIWNCVVQPESLSLSANVSPRMIQPSPVPNVNQHAETPKLNAN